MQNHEKNMPCLRQPCLPAATSQAATAASLPEATETVADMFPEFIDGLDVRPLGMSGRTVRLLRLRPQVLATPEQQAFLLDWITAKEREAVRRQIEEENGLWATPVWDAAQLELWLDTLALVTGQYWVEGWDSFAAGSFAATLPSAGRG